MVGLDSYHDIVGSDRLSLDDSFHLLDSTVGFIASGKVACDVQPHVATLSLDTQQDAQQLEQQPEQQLQQQYQQQENEQPSQEQQEHLEEKQHNEVSQSPGAVLHSCSRKVHRLLVRNNDGKHPSFLVITVMTSDRRRRPRAKRRGAVRSWKVHWWMIKITLLPARQAHFVQLITCQRVPSHLRFTPERPRLESNMQPISLSLPSDNTPLLQRRNHKTCLPS